jgi:hypothetical protein
MATSIPDLMTAGAPTMNRGRSGERGPAEIAGRDLSQYDPRKYILILRFALVNLVGFVALALAYFHGYIDLIRAGDDTHQCDAIFLVFLAGLVICGGRVLQVSRELNLARSFDPSAESEAARYVNKLRNVSSEGRGIMADALRLRLGHRITAVRHIANSLVLLGLIGTVVGFIIALSGVDPQRASDVSAISPMVSTLIRGMSTALYTTLVGSVLNIWLMVDYRLLATGTVKLVTTVTELGERHGRA